MRLAYTTSFDSTNVHKWSGTPYYMSNGFIQQGAHVDYIGSLKKNLPLFFKLQQIWKKYAAGQRVSPRFNTTVAKSYAEQVSKRLENIKTDCVLAPLISPISYLETKKPIILWTDAIYAGLVAFYQPFSEHSADTIKQGNHIANECLARSSLSIFSSDWAANCAIDLYGVHREKVKVVPFGANIDDHPTLDEIKSIIDKRSTRKIKLLFLAKCWERKGGDIVLKVAEALYNSGYPVQLTIVGYRPEELISRPYIKCVGYISKRTPEGKAQIQQFLAESHFLFVPSRAEAFGIVFCEANAYGVPCLTSYVGGIGTVVKDNINGKTFSLHSSVDSYCDYIVNTLNKRQIYNQLALSSYNEFITRLNWKVATSEVMRLIEEIL